MNAVRISRGWRRSRIGGTARTPSSLWDVIMRSGRWSACAPGRLTSPGPATPPGARHACSRVHPERARRPCCRNCSIAGWARRQRRTAPARSGSGAVLPVVVHWSDLGSEETVVRAVLKAVDSGLDETCRQTQSSEARASAGVAGWFRTGKRSGQTTSPPALTFVELLEAVTSFHGGGWPGPVA